jgi:hypothetical protein
MMKDTQKPAARRFGLAAGLKCLKGDVFARYIFYKGI